MYSASTSRTRTALGGYNLRHNLIKPLRYRPDYSLPVEPRGARRTFTGIDTEGLAMDHDSDSLRSSSDIHTDSTIGEVAESIASSSVRLDSPSARGAEGGNILPVTAIGSQLHSTLVPTDSGTAL